jgi:uncharacterized membrane protein YtjA (UPF0391 family)
MLRLAAGLLLIAIVAALFGFGGIAVGAVAAAEILCAIFMIAAMVAFIVGGRRV